MKEFEPKSKEAIKEFFRQYRQYCQEHKVDCLHCPMRMMCYSLPIDKTNGMLDHALSYFEFELDTQAQGQTKVNTATEDDADKMEQKVRRWMFGQVRDEDEALIPHKVYIDKG